MIEIEGVKVSGTYSTVGEVKSGLVCFDLIISHKNKIINYKYYSTKLPQFVEEDPDGFLFPELTERGLYTGLRCFIFEALEPDLDRVYDRRDAQASYLGLSTSDLEWIEDCIIRKYMKPPGHLRTNI
jgi:hypothetical protein